MARFKVFTTKQLTYIVILKTRGLSWSQITKQLNEKFSLRATSPSVRASYQRIDLAKFNIQLHELDDFTKESLGSIIKNKNIKKGTFFVTAAGPTSHVDYTEYQLGRVNSGKYVNASNVHKKAFKSLQTFCKRRKAELVILPMRAHVKPLHNQPQHFDPILKPYLKSFATEYIFNEHLKAVEVHLNPQQSNPLTGLNRLRGTYDNSKRFKSSILVAHAKQDMQSIPTGNDTHPRIIHSTGCITEASYLNNKVGTQAKDEHVVGGLIVEINGPIFHLRQIQVVSKDGSFVDLGSRYHSDGRVTRERAKGFVIGDTHIGHECKNALKATKEQMQLLKPEEVALHDVFDGSSITHHVEKTHITKAKIRTGKFGEFFKTLESELAYNVKVLNQIFDYCPKDAKILMVASNHNDFLNRYLQDGRYVKDHVNHEIAHRMVVDIYDGNNPLQKYIDPTGRMCWLDRNKDYFIEGVQVNVHGDLGPNGSRGAKNGLEYTHGNSIGAHTHCPGNYKRYMNVGHTSKERHGYNNGPSSWIQANAVIYKNGQKQLILIINGKWRNKAKV